MDVPLRKKGNARNGRSRLVMLYVPCGSEEEAARIAHALVAENLIACGNLYPSRSVYNWQGSTVDERECLLICKTGRLRVAAAEKRIAEIHSYEVPCIIRIEPESVNGRYEAWVLEQLAAPARPGGEHNSEPVSERAAREVNS